jgi:hypothetical protein|uniref:hypothetical protein n=1 Tax=Polynucleobacter sp. TaxID=2029855 RepID=UPI0040477310
MQAASKKTLFLRVKTTTINLWCVDDLELKKAHLKTGRDVISENGRAPVPQDSLYTDFGYANNEALIKTPKN